MTEQNGTYYLVDGSIYIFQSHFSPHVECVDVDGNDLSAVYGFTQFLLQFIRRVKPDRIAVALDESLLAVFDTTSVRTINPTGSCRTKTSQCN